MVSNICNGSDCTICSACCRKITNVCVNKQFIIWWNEKVAKDCTVNVHFLKGKSCSIVCVCGCREEIRRCVFSKKNDCEVFNGA